MYKIFIDFMLKAAVVLFWEKIRKETEGFENYNRFEILIGLIIWHDFMISIANNIILNNRLLGVSLNNEFNFNINYILCFII